jgi:tetratricopeptide (TPR) repeat protein
MQSLDISKACDCYQQAVSLLLSLQQQKEDKLENYRSLLASTLTQLAECKVSLGDVDAAREDFELALEYTLQEEEEEEALVSEEQSKVVDDPIIKANPLKAALYLSIGQLCLADEARLAYEQGILEYEKLVHYGTTNNNNNKDNNIIKESNDDWKSSLARAHCAIAELYLTDLCDMDNAEQKCEYHVQTAIQLCDPPILDALQVLTSLRLSQKNSPAMTQQDDTNPTTYIWTVYQHMKQGCEALSALVGLHNSESYMNPTTEEDDDDDDNQVQHGANELVELEAVEQLPSFEFRCQTSKLLLECAVWTDKVHIPCVHAAIQVLGSLLAEQDEVIEVWYLLGCAFQLLTKASSVSSTIHELSDLAKYYWQRALEMLQKVHEQLGAEMDHIDEKNGDDDDDDDEVVDPDDDDDDDDDYRDDLLQQLNQCECQMEEIHHKLGSLEESIDLPMDDDKNDIHANNAMEVE